VSSESDVIDLETGEIVVDNGHLKSLPNSSLWDPVESEEDEGDFIITRDHRKDISQRKVENAELWEPHPDEDTIFAQRLEGHNGQDTRFSVIADTRLRKKDVGNETHTIQTHVPGNGFPEDRARLCSRFNNDKPTI